MMSHTQQHCTGGTIGQDSPTSSAERVLTLSVPAGQERSLTGNDIKKMSWGEYTFLYEVRRALLWQLVQLTALGHRC